MGNKIMKERIAGIASLPDRVDCLEDTIISLYDQVDKIVVGLNNYTEIPEFLKMKKIEVHLLDNSLGDAAKFYKIDDYPNHYYFSCDDDLIYPTDYCDVLIEKCEKYKSIVGLHGVILNKPVTSYYKNRKVYHCLKPLKLDVEVDLLGCGACLIDTSILKISINDFPVANMGDIWLGDLCKKQNIKSYTIERGEDWLIYNKKMNDKWTIFEDFKSKKDIVQTNIVSKW
jgi:hypothetical protein